MLADTPVSATPIGGCNVSSETLTDRDIDDKIFSLSSYGARLSNAYKRLLHSYSAGDETHSKIAELT